jgi:signal transduction histidine kinase
MSAQEKTGIKKIDSLFNILPSIKVDTVKIMVLNDIADRFLSRDPNKSIIYCKQALQLSKKIKWNDGIALSLRNIGQNTAFVGDIDKADKYFDNALTFAESKLNKCLLYRAKGTVNSSTSNYPKAIEYYFKALKIAEEIKNDKETARISRSIGNSYGNIKDFKKALFYLKKALEIDTKINLKDQMGRDIQSIGSIYKDEKKFPQAIYYFSKALAISNELGDENGVGFVNIELGQIYQSQKEFEKALKCFKSAKVNLIKTKNHQSLTVCKFEEANTYLLQYNSDSTNLKKRSLLQKAELLYNESIKDFKKSKDNINISECYQSLSELYFVTNNYKKAAKVAIEYAELKDSIFTDKSKETIKNLEDQRTIELKNKEILINNITLENKEKQKWIYIFGIGFLTILGFSLFYQNQNRKKTNEKLQVLNNNLDKANKTKIKFLSILNHDLRSPVYNFIHFMQLQKESPELLDDNTKNEIESKTILSAENLLISMEDILLWSKGQMDNFEPQFKTININDIFEYAKNHFESEDKVKLFFENQDNISLITDENFLKTIIRNLTGNAIKALDCFVPRNDNDKPKIIWNAYKTDNQIFLSISDNGAGANDNNLKALFDDTEVVGIKTGLGLHLIRDLAKAIDCEISVESKIGFGTTFILKFNN